MGRDDRIPDHGQKRALLFYTGMGVGDLRSLVAGLTPLTVIVL